VRNAFTVSNIGECEKMCYSEEKFKCSVFSYRYSDPSSNNCLLCDRSFSLLDSYADIVPDRSYDIYSMSDDMSVCKSGAHSRGENSVGGYGGNSNDRKKKESKDFQICNSKFSFQNVSSEALTPNASSNLLCEIH
jgi:PAN domain